MFTIVQKLIYIDNKKNLIKWVGAGRYMSNSNKYQYIPNWTCISLLGETYKNIYIDTCHIYIHTYTYIHIQIYTHTHTYIHTYIHTDALENLWWILSTKLVAVPKINPRFGTNTLHSLHGHSLHIRCLPSFLKRLIVFLCLNSSGKIFHDWGAWWLIFSKPQNTVLFLSD